jgi:TRAP-type C4-dicarboxylate transport system permease small subunit
MAAALRLLDKITSALASISSVVLVALTILIFCDALARGFGFPIEGSRDLTALGLALITLCGIPYAGRTDGHIVVDLLPEFPSAFLNRFREVFVRLVAIAIFGLLTWQAWLRAEDAADFNEASNILEIPFQPFFYVMMIAAGVYTLILLVEGVLIMLGRSIPRFENRFRDSVGSPE